METSDPPMPGIQPDADSITGAIVTAKSLTAFGVVAVLTVLAAAAIVFLVVRRKDTRKGRPTAPERQPRTWLQAVGWTAFMILPTAAAVLLLTGMTLYMMDPDAKAGETLTVQRVSSNPGTFWFPSQGSTFAAGVDGLFFMILGISVFFTVAITAMMIYFVVKYRYRDGVSTAGTSNHNTALEVLWSVAPSFVLIVIFVGGASQYMDMVTPPREAYEINVTAQKWAWSFTYPNGAVSNELHVPLGRPVKLLMTSKDVLHDLYIPVFRTKHDVVPGRYNHVWFEAIQEGEYVAFCAEYCGQQHSKMMAKVVVEPQGVFDKWIEDQNNPFEDADGNPVPPAEVGRILYVKHGCNQCHRLDEKPYTGPPWQGRWGKEVAMADGQQVLVDENYIRESILEPGAKVAKGYNPQMPSYQGRLSDREIGAIIALIKSLNGQDPKNDILSKAEQAAGVSDADAAGDAKKADTPSEGAADGAR